MKTVYRKNVVSVACLVLSTFATGQAYGQAANRQTDRAELRRLADRLDARYRVEHNAALQWANQQNLTGLRIEQRDGAIAELVGFRDGRPIYYITNNANAADTVSTDEVQVGGSSGLDLTGAGVRLHIWDGGAVLTSHDELVGRVTLKNNVGTSTHSTHVAGTMIASGVSAAARGMATSATLDSYDFNNDDAEMATAAPDALVSNHSYGFVTGWAFGNFGLGNAWYWFGDVAIDVNEDPGFGRYDSSTRAWDEIAFNAPFYTIVKSAGNDRNDSRVGTHFHLDGGAFVSSGDAHPKDGGVLGFDCVSYKGNAKNILTVGAVSDIVGGYTNPSDVIAASFTSWGPTDDGRIKPDLVANGVALTSSSNAGNSSYTVFSGTSMSAPNTTGSLGLLVEHYRATHDGQDMRSATLKALAIHTTDEAGSAAGPDYSFGWGLLNTLRAANTITADETSFQTIQELSLAQNQTISQTWTYSGSGAFKVTIAWTDPPGTPVLPVVVDSPDRMLVNDLDLRIIGPGNTVFEPWVLDPANPVAAATTGDNDRDNVEVVLIDVPVAGEYTVEISHKGSIGGVGQDFGLILTGALASCGDGTCSAGQEGKCNCPSDCGVPLAECCGVDGVAQETYVLSSVDIPVTQNRYLSFVPPQVPAGASGVGLRVTFTKMPGPNDCPLIDDYSAFQGIQMWVGEETSQANTAGVTSPTGVYTLQSTARFTDWRAENPTYCIGASGFTVGEAQRCGTGAPLSDFVSEAQCNAAGGSCEPLVIISDCNIVPCAAYTIEVIPNTCDLAAESFSTPILIATTNPGAACPSATARWADIVGLYDPTTNRYNLADGCVDFLDIAAMIERFKNLAKAPPRTWCDLVGGPGAISGETMWQGAKSNIDFNDVSAVVGAFAGESYPLSGPTAPSACP